MRKFKIFDRNGNTTEIRADFYKLTSDGIDFIGCFDSDGNGHSEIGFLNSELDHVEECKRINTTRHNFDSEAKRLCDAIRNFNDNPEALENFESYLSHHFSEWLNKWGDTPSGLADEFRNFSRMI